MGCDLGIRKKVRAEKSSNCQKKYELFSSRTFSSIFFEVHTELEVLQRWQATHFKAYLTLKDKKNCPSPEIHLELSEN